MHACIITGKASPVFASEKASGLESGGTPYLLARQRRDRLPVSGAHRWIIRWEKSWLGWACKGFLERGIISSACKWDLCECPKSFEIRC